MYSSASIRSCGDACNHCARSRSSASCIVPDHVTHRDGLGIGASVVTAIPSDATLRRAALRVVLGHRAAELLPLLVHGVGLAGAVQHVELALHHLGDGLAGG